MTALLEANSQSSIVEARSIVRPSGMFSLNGQRAAVESLLSDRTFLDIALQAAFQRKVLDITGAPQAIDCLIGAPGSGKDTQKALLQQKYAKLGLYLAGVSTGDKFKAHLKNPQSPFHDKCVRDSQLMLSGALAQDDGIKDIVYYEYNLAKWLRIDRMVFTGFPRTDAQLDALVSIVEQEKEMGHEIPLSLASLVVRPITPAARSESRNRQVAAKLARGERAEYRPDDKPDVVARRVREHLNGPAMVSYRLAIESEGYPHDSIGAYMIERYVKGYDFPAGVDELSYQVTKNRALVTSSLINGERAIEPIHDSVNKVLPAPKLRQYHQSW